MNNFLFDHENMQKYWSCDNRTTDEWNALAKPSLTVGLLYLILGSIYLAIYLPCWISLLRSELIKFSAYKFMAFLGLIDTIGLLNTTFYCGYASIVGMIYCMAPITNYMSGICAFSCWVVSSTTCVLLALSRCIDFFSAKAGRALYAEKKTYIWLCIPMLYSIHIIFVAGGCVFNANTYAFTFDPFLGLPERHDTLDTEHYPHMTLAIHNLAVPTILILIYIILCAILAAQMKGIRKHDRSLGKMQRSIMYQALTICSVTLFGSLLYDYSSFFPVGKFYTIASEISLLSVHGLHGITYLLFNKTIRNDVFALLFKKSAKITVSKVSPTDNLNNTGGAKKSSTQDY